MTTFPTRELSRRQYLSLAAAASLSAPMLSSGSTLSGFYYRDYSKCLPNYLASLAHAAYEKRNLQLSLLKTPAAIHQRQRWTRDTFWTLAGGEPERTPLNARVTGQLERSTYRIEKVIYESQPGVIVSANLYLPKATESGPFPGILFQMGHAYNGKSYAPYQKCCQALATLGYVVLAFDPMGQGERIAYPDASGTNTRLASVDDEHSLPGKQLLLLGDSATRYQVWDAIRSLDYLASHPLVDLRRLASTGQSGGATVTMLLSCVDPRLSCAVICSGNTENFASAKFNPPGSTDDAEQDLIGSGPLGFDRWDLLYPLAPKPLLVQVSAHDFFGTYSPQHLDDGREQFKRLSDLYTALGHPDRLAWHSTPLAHGLTYELRLGIYNWFERWLKNSHKELTLEPSVVPEEDSGLWCGPTGSVARDFQSLRPIDLIKQHAQTVTHPRNDNTAWAEALNIRRPAPSLRIGRLAQTPLAGITVKATEINPAPHIWIPAWFFLPNKPDPSQASLIVLDDRGRNAHAHEDGLYHRLAQSGRSVCVADIRGMGDARPEVGRGNPGYTVPHNAEEEYGWASLILGDSLLSQRITDILALTQALTNDIGPRQRLAIAARGHLTVPALFAFALDERLTALYLAGGLASYKIILETENYQQPIANFAWKLYELIDLPALASRSAKGRRIHLAGTVDASNHPLPPAAVRQIYPDPNIQITADAAWDQAAFRAL